MESWRADEENQANEEASERTAKSKHNIQLIWIRCALNASKTHPPDVRMRVFRIKLQMAQTHTNSYPIHFVCAHTQTHKIVNGPTVSNGILFAFALLDAHLKSNINGAT